MSSMCPCLAQVEDVANRVDVILGVEGHPVFGNVLVELAVDPEPADLAQPIAVGIEELLMEQLACLLQLRRIARPQPLVDPEQSTLVIGGRVFLQRLENKRILGLLEDPDRAQLARIGQHLRRGLEIVVPLSIKTSPVLGSTTSPQAIGPQLGGRLRIGRVDSSTS